MGVWRFLGSDSLTIQARLLVLGLAACAAWGCGRPHFYWKTTDASQPDEVVVVAVPCVAQILSIDGEPVKDATCRDIVVPAGEHILIVAWVSDDVGEWTPTVGAQMNLEENEHRDEFTELFIGGSKYSFEGGGMNGKLRLEQVQSAR